MKTTLQTPIRRLLAAASLLALSASLAAKPEAVPQKDFHEAQADLRIGRIAHAKNSADWLLEKGKAYQIEATKLYNGGQYKRAYRLFMKAEKEIGQATRKYHPQNEREKLGDAYYRLGLVCERTQSDKSVARECYRKAYEASPQDGRSARKLLRDRQGRAHLGADKVKELGNRGGRNNG